MISDLGADVPVTEAKIELIVAMLGGTDAVRRKLVDLGINQAGGDDATAVVSTRHDELRK